MAVIYIHRLIRYSSEIMVNCSASRLADRIPLSFHVLHFSIYRRESFQRHTHDHQASKATIHIKNGLHGSRISGNIYFHLQHADKKSVNENKCLDHIKILMSRQTVKPPAYAFPSH